MSKNKRGTLDERLMKRVASVAKDATCPRLRVGAILVQGKRPLSEGYNGAPEGVKHCDDIGCRVIDNHCRGVVHAELNAIINAARKGVSTMDSVMYCEYRPCLECIKAIINAGIKEVVYSQTYHRHKKEHSKEQELADQITKEAGLVIRKFRGRRAEVHWIEDD